MARYVPERMDDFVFENNLIAGRIYGAALEGNPTSPGIDIWVKLPGKLVADDWYRQFSVYGNEEYYHHDHGGKDCYKVAVSLGGGASAPYVDGKLMLPPTNYRSYKIIEQSKTKVVFRLDYPWWDIQEGVRVKLEKTITVTPNTYFFKCQDCYSFEGTDCLTVVAGINRHAALQTIEREMTGKDRYALWEAASDQKFESEDGMLGVGVYVPGADFCCVMEDQSHGICGKSVESGETFTYYFGSCWSKGLITSAEDWFELVEQF